MLLFRTYERTTVYPESIVRTGLAGSHVIEQSSGKHAVITVKLAVDYNGL